MIYVITYMYVICIIMQCKTDNNVKYDSFICKGALSKYFVSHLFRRFMVFEFQPGSQGALKGATKGASLPLRKKEHILLSGGQIVSSNRGKAYLGEGGGIKYALRGRANKSHA